MKGDKVYKAIEDLFVSSANQGVLFVNLLINEIKVYKHRGEVFAYVYNHPIAQKSVIGEVSIDELFKILNRLNEEIQNQAFACLSIARKIQPISIDYIPPDAFYPDLEDEDADLSTIDLAGMRVELTPFEDKDIMNFNIQKCLIHPHIISTLGTTSIRNKPYIVSEKQFKFSEVHLEFKEKIRVIEQILQAACMLKLKNIDFRVILPEQIYLTLNKKAKLKVNLNPPGTHE